MPSRHLLASTARSALFAWAVSLAMPAHAFSDDEARKAILDLRTTVNALRDQLGAAQRTILDQSNRLDQLQGENAQLRGQTEEALNQLNTIQLTQKDYYADLDKRLKKFEPQQTTVDGVEGVVQPGENDAFNAALKQFRDGNYKAATGAFSDFIRKYPQSPYQPTAHYWLGNAYYAQRDYAKSTAELNGVVKNYPTHPRAPEALLSIANNQADQNQKSAERQTLQRVISQYPGTPAAQNAQERLSKLR
ncbi:tol-pal system protein YbgF [Chitinasiproducens palmae]|uniref:Cell division coordinator CpoB n=1 Tax=Chitinasiproducens palmae TaxID=1770053 RepID=A0A1H2PSX6_9BURK|nr:tol-pal system protein YbgF [Chitinasiproducens palmae]SDV50160.1 tol-pal system protein YbgF [Chitinasiproducens palmae]